MNKQFCPKCGAAISNEFGNMLAFCTSCGASMSFGQTEQKFSLNETEATPSPSRQPKYGSQTGGFYQLARGFCRIKLTQVAS